MYNVQQHEQPAIHPYGHYYAWRPTFCHSHADILTTTNCCNGVVLNADKATRYLARYTTSKLHEVNKPHKPLTDLLSHTAMFLYRYVTPAAARKSAPFLRLQQYQWLPTCITPMPISCRITLCTYVN